MIKYKKRTPGHKELLNLFNDLLDAILTDKTLESESQEDKNKNENEKVESRKEENKNENENAENKKIVTNTKKDENESEDENKNMLLEYMEDVDDKLFKIYSHDKDFNSFIDEFHHATNKEDKEKVFKELKEMSSLVNHYAQWENDFGEYKYKLFNINAIIFWMNTLKTQQVIFNWGKWSKIVKQFM